MAIDPDLPPNLPPDLMADVLMVDNPNTVNPPADFIVHMPWPGDSTIELLTEEILLPDGRRILPGISIYTKVAATLQARWHAGGFWIFLIHLQGTPRAAWVHEHTPASQLARPLWERIPDVDAPARPTA